MGPIADCMQLDHGVSLRPLSRKAGHPPLASRAAHFRPHVQAKPPAQIQAPSSSQHTRQTLTAAPIPWRRSWHHALARPNVATGGKDKPHDTGPSNKLFPSLAQGRCCGSARWARRGPRGAPWLAANLIWQGPLLRRRPSAHPRLVCPVLLCEGVSTAPAAGGAWSRSASIDALGVAFLMPFPSCRAPQSARDERTDEPAKRLPVRCGPAAATSCGFASRRTRWYQRPERAGLAVLELLAGPW